MPLIFSFIVLATACKSRQLTINASGERNAVTEMASKTTIEERLDAVNTSSASASASELINIAEQLEATITTERLDTSGRVVERTTTHLTATKEGRTERQRVAERRDTSATAREVEVIACDTLARTIAEEAKIDYIDENAPNYAGMCIALAIIAAIIYVLNRLKPRILP